MAALSVLNPVGFPPKVTRQTLAPRLDTAAIADADHAYTGCAADVANVVADWAATLTP